MHRTQHWHQGWVILPFPCLWFDITHQTSILIGSFCQPSIFVGITSWSVDTEYQSYHAFHNGQTRKINKGYSGMCIRDIQYHTASYIRNKTSALGNLYQSIITLIHNRLLIYSHFDILSIKCTGMSCPNKSVHGMIDIL